MMKKFKIQSITQPSENIWGIIHHRLNTKRIKDLLNCAVNFNTDVNQQAVTLYPCTLH